MRFEHEDALACAIIDAVPVTAKAPGVEGLIPYLQYFDATVRITTLPAGLCGQTGWGEDGLMIDISSRDSTNRKVFTLAHEIGHILLDQASVRVELAGMLPATSFAIERLCDNLAGRILMPGKWVEGAVKEITHEGQILEVAEEIGVSTQALVIRLSQAGTPALFVSAVLTLDGKWRSRVRAGSLSNTAAAQLNLDALATCRMGTTRLREAAPLPEWKVKDRVVGEIRRGSKEAILWFVERPPCAVDALRVAEDPRWKWTSESPQAMSRTPEMLDRRLDQQV